MRTYWPIAVTGFLCILITLLISYLLWGKHVHPNRKALSAPSLIDAAEKGKAASVFIFPVKSDTSQFYYDSQTGSGVIVSEDGYIVTNHHVIAGSVRVQVLLDNRHEYTAQIVGTDSTHDIALLKINAKSLPFLEFGNSDLLRIGEQVLAVGSPNNLYSTVTYGIISGKDRKLELSTNATANYIQTDAPTNFGNSGGALLNIYGSLVGINVAIITNSGQYEGFTFTIPSNLVKKIVEDIIQYGSFRGASIGMAIGEVDGVMATQAGLKGIYGVWVGSLTPGGAADKAGVQPLDILTSINGNQITSKSYFMGRLDMLRPGDTIELEIVRNGVVDTVEVKMEERMKK